MSKVFSACAGAGFFPSEVLSLEEPRILKDGSGIAAAGFLVMGLKLWTCCSGSVRSSMGSAQKWQLRYRLPLLIAQMYLINVIVDGKGYLEDAYTRARSLSWLLLSG